MTIAWKYKCQKDLEQQCLHLRIVYTLFLTHYLSMVLAKLMGDVYYAFYEV
jgi:hypothetical protein